LGLLAALHFAFPPGRFLLALGLRFERFFALLDVRFRSPLALAGGLFALLGPGPRRRFFAFEAFFRSFFALLGFQQREQFGVFRHFGGFLPLFFGLFDFFAAFGLLCAGLRPFPFFAFLGGVPTAREREGNNRDQARERCPSAATTAQRITRRNLSSRSRYHDLDRRSSGAVQPQRGAEPSV
jgi:hypothetical protein